MANAPLILDPDLAYPVLVLSNPVPLARDPSQSGVMQHIAAPFNLRANR
jgi:hypothetical protein